jgi:hypothetical protein
MITRRKLLRGSVSGFLGAELLLAGIQSSDANASSVSRFDTAVVDRRFADSRHFGSCLKTKGVAVRSFAADVTELWFRELDPLWRERQASVAGLTTYRVLFCLERLAWDHRMRVIFSAKHETTDGVLRHTLPTSAASLAPRLRNPDGSWARQVAQWLSDTPLDAAPTTASSIVQLPQRPGSDRSQPLFSWVIALPRKT